MTPSSLHPIAGTQSNVAMEHPERRPLVYVASRASIPERGQMWRKMRDLGARIVSSWIDEDGEGQTEDFSELWQRIENEIRSAERLVLYVEPDDFPLKGALIEVGMALAMGKPVFIAAPGVTLEPRSFRPLGSWAQHPQVKRIEEDQILAAVMGNVEHISISGKLIP